MFSLISGCILQVRLLLSRTRKPVIDVESSPEKPKRRATKISSVLIFGKTWMPQLKKILLNRVGKEFLIFLRLQDYPHLLQPLRAANANTLPLDNYYQQI